MSIRMMTLLALAGSTAFAASVAGTVESVSSDAIRVKAGAQPVVLHIDGRTEIWKGKAFHDLSPVAVGDRIAARYETDASGRLVARAVWLDIANVAAVITKVTPNGFEVLTNPNADPQSAYRKENKFIAVDPGTEFDSSSREDLRVGRNVQVVGVTTGAATIRAARVTVYEGQRPVRMRRDVAVVRPDGTREP